jgi:hypothetical protein
LKRVSVTKLPEWSVAAAATYPLGRPLYVSAPRLSDCRRYIEDPALRQSCEAYVAQRGGASFFERRQWRKELTANLQAFRRNHPDGSRYETDEERREAMWRELDESKKEIEAHLAGKSVRHFCYPWDDGCRMGFDLSVQAGYTTNFVRQTATQAMGVTPGTPMLVSRFSNDWIFTLPGRGRRSFLDPVRLKIVRWASLPLRQGAQRPGQTPTSP